jgi:molybdopterin-binding protein
MKISARNVFDGTVKEVHRGATTSHVVVDVKGVMMTSSITNEAVDELGLKTGSKVKTIIKSSDVMVAIS